MRIRGDREASGAPGMEPRWSHGNKEGIGTAYSADSKLWFTLFRGVVTEVYYPLVDHPQLRDLQFLVVAGDGRFLEERRHLLTETKRLPGNALGYTVTSRDPAGTFRLEKEIVSSPHLPCLLERCRWTATAAGGQLPSLFLLAAPHLDVAGAGNNAYVVELPGRTVLAAERNGTWLALGASIPFARASVGYVGATDGWTDLNAHRRLEFEFDRAPNGNVALTAELNPGESAEFTVALAFGRGLAHAVTTLLQALGEPFEDQRRRFEAQWARVAEPLEPLAEEAGDGGNLLHSSYSLLLAHEDKTFPGAFIASLSIPWGHAKGDADRGGYHLVWTRDLVQVALGLVAAGDMGTARRTLLYLAASQRPDGGFPQNFWLDGEPYWTGVQLDEVAFPILLAHRLHQHDGLALFDPAPMVMAAAGYLIRQGPATGQERWEEAGGYSPSTLAASIASLLVAGHLARRRTDAPTAALLEAYADFLEGHLEDWTTTTRGTLVPGMPRHYVRIVPTDPATGTPAAVGAEALVTLANQPPGSPTEVPARSVVDAGFLELVRYGIRSADDPWITASLRVVDSLLRVETPFGPSWRRYNGDGYGDPGDGSAFGAWGVGHAWPLLTGERGHYELARGGDARPFLRAMERFATPTGLLTEQVWDRPDRPELHLRLGRPTEAAMPLAWAHAEYLKLLRSTRDGDPFDRIPEVVDRYRLAAARQVVPEVYKAGYRPASVPAGRPLWVIQPAAFRLHWSTDDWRTVTDTDSTPTATGLHFVVLDRMAAPGGAVVFTSYWTDAQRWEGEDHRVDVGPARAR